MIKNMTHYVYLARCNDGSLYCGTCIDPVAREAKHNAGTGAKYTRSRRPVKFVYIYRSRALSDARRREATIKRMSKTEKESLITGR